MKKRKAPTKEYSIDEIVSALKTQEKRLEPAKYDLEITRDMVEQEKPLTNEEIVRALNLPEKKTDAYIQDLRRRAKNLAEDAVSATSKVYRSVVPAKKFSLDDIPMENVSPSHAKDDIEISDINKTIIGDKQAYYAAMEKYKENKSPGSFLKDFDPLKAIVQTKAGLSEFKLKLEASKYGITPKEFEKAKEENKLREIAEYVHGFKKKEQELEKMEASTQRIHSETYDIYSQAAQRYSKINAPYGENRPMGAVQFGYRGFVGESTPIYLYNYGSHSKVREKLLPKTTPIHTKSVESRLAMLRMRESLLKLPRMVSFKKR